MKKIICLVLSLLIFVSVFSFTYAGVEEISTDEVFSGYDTTISLIKLLGITDKTEAEILKSALINLSLEDKETFYRVLDAIAKSVDENSAYYTPEEWESFYNDMSGVTGGIGVIATVVGNYFEVMSTIEGGAAETVGIETGDRIIEADGVDLTGKNALLATNYLRGEIGTEVKIKVLKKDGTIKAHTLIRREIIEPSVWYTTINDNIGYLRLYSFTNKSPTECRDALSEFKEKNIKNVILDLRNNGGGVLDSALSIASLFMKKGETIISVKGKKEEDTENYTVNNDGFDFDVAILINENTASASEVVTAAVVENGHGVSIGNTSYGKATVQQLFPLTVGGALRITVKQYLTPKGNFINKEGIRPTFEVSNRTFKYTFDELPKFTLQKRLELNEQSDDVLTAKKLLNMLNYNVKDLENNVYDESVKAAVAAFQEKEGLFPYGVCDITTQSYLVNKVLETEFTEDTQLEYAINYFNKGE